MSKAKNNIFKYLITLTTMGAIFGVAFSLSLRHGAHDFVLEPMQPFSQEMLVRPADRYNVTGSYLSAQFAQRHHDWQSASTFLDHIHAAAPEDDILMKKSMVLSMGAGQLGKAMAFAKRIDASGQPDALTLLFLAMQATKEQNYERAAEYIARMPEDGLSSFIAPLVNGWIRAAQGQQDIGNLTGNTIHLYHAILIADYLDEPSAILPILQRAQSVENLPLQDLERIANIYGHIGERKKAIALYKRILAQSTKNREVIFEKIKALENGEEVNIFEAVMTPQEGLARAMYDMAEILYGDYADDSARVFAHMALYLDPRLSDAALLLASIAVRNNQVDQAIVHYQSVQEGDKYFLDARKQVANLLEDQKKFDRAIAELEILAAQYDDLDSLIKVGDIYRREGEFEEALKTYNEVAGKLGDAIPEEYWYLHYVRGMSYERAGDWDKAEQDLKAALEMQPDHPYVMNYLGYAWADRGDNLQESLSLLRRAVALRPMDAYITDSLGWIYFKMNDYENAALYLEKAVELLPQDPVINDHLGDVYWRLGRRSEARFQWERAVNHGDDEELNVKIQAKLDNGMDADDVVTAAQSEQNTLPQNVSNR